MHWTFSDLHPTGPVCNIEHKPSLHSILNLFLTYIVQHSSDFLPLCSQLLQLHLFLPGMKYWRFSRSPFFLSLYSLQVINCIHTSPSSPILSEVTHRTTSPAQTLHSTPDSYPISYSTTPSECPKGMCQNVSTCPEFISCSCSTNLVFFHESLQQVKASPSIQSHNSHPQYCSPPYPIDLNISRWCASLSMAKSNPEESLDSKCIKGLNSNFVILQFF